MAPVHIRPTILHLGDPIRYNHALYSHLQADFNIIRPPYSELGRSEFVQHLQNMTWGDFSAIIRPFPNTGREMGIWDRELIELLPRSVRMIASAGTSSDWVDTKVLGEYGTPLSQGCAEIKVVNTDECIGILYTSCAGASTESVADMALHLIISVFRQTTWSSLAARSNPTAFKRAHVEVPLRSHSPRGHTLGIVGLGIPGFAIAKKAEVALGMRILYHDVLRKSSNQVDKIRAIFYDSLEEMLRASDCLLLATTAGRPILDARSLALLPRGSRIIKVARGSLVDEDALADALESGHISAAGLDVYSHEPDTSERLKTRSDVTLVSHIGGGSVDTIAACERSVLENVRAVLDGREPLTAVNKHYMKAQRSTVNDIRIEPYSRSFEATAAKPPQKTAALLASPTFYQYDSRPASIERSEYQDDFDQAPEFQSTVEDTVAERWLVTQGIDKKSDPSTLFDSHRRMGSSYRQVYGVASNQDDVSDKSDEDDFHETFADLGAARESMVRSARFIVLKPG